MFFIIACLLVFTSSSHKSDKEGESEAELEHKARVWIDALLDRVVQKQAQEKNDFQKSVDRNEINIV